MKRLGLQPRRTIRFATWNGEEQGLYGSWAYVEQHADELDRHVMAASFDIGTGAIEGIMTNGRGDEVREVLDRALAPVAGPNYHARSDTFDKADLHQLKLNSAIVAALIWGFANDDVTWSRWSRAQIAELVETQLKGQMQSFGAWESWAEGRRGRQPE